MRVEIKGDTASAHDGDRYLGMVRKDPCGGWGWWAWRPCLYAPNGLEEVGGPYATRDLALAALGYSRAVSR